MNKIIIKTRILEFLANDVLPACEGIKSDLGIKFADYIENDWKTIIDIDSPARLLGFPLKLCELDFKLNNKDFTITLTVQILDEDDIGGFFTICWEHGTMCAKELFFDELSEIDSQKIRLHLKLLLDRMAAY